MNPRAGESRQRVYGGYTRAELDAQYDTALPAGGDVQRYFDRFTAASESARSLCPFETLRYGAGDRETVDIFPAGRAGAPLFVWLHGGYWRRMSKESFSFVAPPVVAAGGAVAVVNYPLAPAATLAEIVAAVRRAYAFVIGSTRASGANDPRIVVGGHSVGAQLAAMTAAVAAVHGFLALSGLYELEPLLHTQINETIAMDADVARRYGPIHVPPLQPAPLVLACGEREQPEFHRQQRDYAAAWRAWGGTARELAAPGHDHFSIVLELADAGSPLSAALLEMLSS